ncbi:hypothetical protein TERTU_1037 [Teredinibacter turnerae T7901]|uniref:Uncharacterized protein n=1 Tax=Teredinibacter turnerae (strain ATCC 39867 / T7901) TaxID=377629 RepID=C5BQW9_TERTT|nr:hypothetical protein TERTU_1037 [Teredinibacter turnerae T7901]
MPPFLQQNWSETLAALPAQRNRIPLNTGPGKATPPQFAIFYR